MSKVYTVDEIATLKGVTKQAVWRAARVGILPPVASASGQKTNLYPAASVRRYISIRRGRSKTK